MKNFKCHIFFFAILFPFSIFLESCSNESTLTSPLEKRAMSKPLVNTVATINHTIDTIITLPNSRVSIVISKNLSKDKIASMDDYYSIHTISKISKNVTSPLPQSISPNYRWCSYHIDTILILQNQFAQAPSKILGIWTNDISIYQAHNQYGFSSIIVNDTTDIDSASIDGFSYQNMMYNLTTPSDAQSEINASNSNSRFVGSYFIDEPVEKLAINKGLWASYAIVNIANIVYPKRLLISSFKWPTQPYDLLTSTTYGYEVGTAIDPSSNTYLMCDQYHGDCWGHTYEYWNEFNHYYGSSKNIANWFDVVINNGNGTSGDFCGYAATSWITLLTTADGLGIHEVWLYAVSTGDEAAISSCCMSAWQDLWLLRQQQKLIEVWQNTDGTCNWAIGKWKLIESYYIGYQYTYY